MENSENLTKKQRKELRRQEKLDRQEQEHRSRMLKRILVWAGVFVLLVVAILGARQLANNGPANVPVASIELPSALDEQDHYRGAKDASVVITEYSDFQCPACRNHTAICDQVLAEFPDDVGMVFRHLPLESIHKNAMAAARASEAAANQGRFWEMHDVLYDRQAVWANMQDPSERFAMYAEELGLDAEAYKADYESDEIEARIRRDLDPAMEAGITATPSFFLNGAYIRSSRTYEEFSELIRAFIGAGQDDNQGDGSEE